MILARCCLVVTEVGKKPMNLIAASDGLMTGS
jgi:hypothetical protein